MSAELVRFRADPSKVRVSVRPRDGAFLLRATSRQDPERDSIETVHSDPVAGIMHILEIAAEYIDGIDLGMDGEYPHPMKVAQ